MLLLLISLVSAHNYVVDPTLSQTAPTPPTDATPPMGGGLFNRMKAQGFQHPAMGLAMMDGDFGDFGDFGEFGDFPFFPMAAAATRQARQYGSGAKPMPTSAQQFNPFAAYAFMDFLNKPRAVAPITPVRLSSPLQVSPPTTPVAPAGGAYGMSGMMNNLMGAMRQYPLFGMSFMQDPEDPFDKMSDYVGDFDFPFFPMAAQQQRRRGGMGAGAKKSMPSSFNPMAAYAFMDFLNKPRATAPITPVRLSAPGPMSMAMMDILNKPRPETVLSSPRKTFIQPVVYPNGEVLYYPVEPVNEQLRQ